MAKKNNIVQKTKSQIKLIVLLLLVFGWIFAVAVMADNSDEKAQQALLQSAEVHLQDDLYIRAVNNYKKAIEEYNTPLNPQIEEKLLALYLEAGMMDDYYSFIKIRIERECAGASEYVALGQHYIDEQSITKAIDVLTTGNSRYESDEIIKLREQIIYDHRNKTISVEELKQPATDWIIPVFDGEKWGYMYNDGRMVIDYQYEEATQFCDGYAVVKLDGVYTLIDTNGYRNAVDKNGLEKVTDISASAIVGAIGDEYRIYSRTFQLLSPKIYEYVYLNDNGLFVVKKDGKWAILSADLEPVTEFIFTDVKETSHGNVFTGKYAMVADEGGYFLINEAGEALYTDRFYDAKGYEGGLIAVADENGKWGYANGSATLIVDYQYTDAKSFSCQLGAVQYAGKWGYINRYNTMMVEPKYESALPFVEGIALAGTELGGYEALQLKYYELF